MPSLAAVLQEKSYCTDTPNQSAQTSYSSLHAVSLQERATVEQTLSRQCLSLGGMAGTPNQAFWGIMPPKFLYRVS